MSLMQRVALVEWTKDPASQTTANFMDASLQGLENEDHHDHLLLLLLQSVIA